MDKFKIILQKKWDISFWYLDGNKNRQFIRSDNIKKLKIKAEVKKGNLALVIKEAGRDNKIINLSQFTDEVTLDISKYPVNKQITLELQSKKAKGAVKIAW